MKRIVACPFPVLGRAGQSGVTDRVAIVFLRPTRRQKLDHVSLNACVAVPRTAAPRARSLRSATGSARLNRASPTSSPLSSRHSHVRFREPLIPLFFGLAVHLGAESAPGRPQHEALDNSYRPNRGHAHSRGQIEVSHPTSVESSPSLSRMRHARRKTAAMHVCGFVPARDAVPPTAGAVCTALPCFDL